MEMLQSPLHEVADAFEANELFQRNGWTDGLPIVPPTEDAVRRCLEAAGLAAGAVVGLEPVRRRRITAEKVAIAAVMAGGRPEYLPVVVAAVRAMCEPEFGLHGVTASTGGSAPFVVANGPVRLTLGMNATHNVLGNGSRPNATIGRALRLLIVNVLGGIPGQLDRSTLGHPGKLTLCVAEDEEDSPWLPLATERGLAPGVSAVTVVAVGSPHQIMNEWTRDPRELAETYAAAIRVNMLTYSIWAGNYAIVASATCASACTSGPGCRAASGGRWARARWPPAGTRTPSTRRCARPTICWWSLPAARPADSARSCRPGTARNPWP
jgi:hypothetical protein